MLYRKKGKVSFFFFFKESSYKLRIFKLVCVDFTLRDNRDPTNLKTTSLLYYPIRFEPVVITLGNPLID